MELHIIYTESDVLLSKARYDSWREIQEQYAGYKASLGPWTPDAVIDYLAADYPDLAPSAAAQVTALLSDDAQNCVLKFK